MPAWTSHRAIAAVGFGTTAMSVAVGCGVAWNGGPSRLQISPGATTVDPASVTTQDRSAAARRVSAFLGRIAPEEWEVEASTMPDSAGAFSTAAAAVGGEQPRRPPMLLVMRHRERLDGRGSLLRVVTFFPRATVADLEERLVDADARRRWDRNYLYGADYCTLPVSGDGTSDAEDPATPCDLRQGFRAVSRHWRGHVVGSPTLARLGVRPRSFLYDRTVGRRARDGAVCCVYRGISPACACGGDVPVVEGAAAVRRSWVHWGDAVARAGWAAATTAAMTSRCIDHVPLSPQDAAAVVDTNSVPGEALARAIRDAFLAGPATGSEEAAMFWQEQLLLPVKGCDLRTFGSRGDSTTAATVLQRAVQRLSVEGDPFASSAAEALGPDGVGSGGGGEDGDVVGTLMVVTSCNDAKTPALPRFVERFGARRLALTSASWLLADLAAPSG